MHDIKKYIIEDGYYMLLSLYNNFAQNWQQARDESSFISVGYFINNGCIIKHLLIGGGINLITHENRYNVRRIDTINMFHKIFKLNIAIIIPITQNNDKCHYYKA